MLLVGAGDIDIQKKRINSSWRPENHDKLI